MGWADNLGNRGWDDVDGGGSSERKDYGPRRFWMPANVTKRVLFLDEDPFKFHEHSLWAITRNQDKELCLMKNGIDKRGCPLCDKEMWPSFIGYLSVIDMGDVSYQEGGRVELSGWTSDKGVTYQFGRKLYGAKRGSQDKPGVLQTLNRERQKRGGLTGAVYDVFRAGKKDESVGNQFEFVEKISLADTRDYLIELGADPERLELDAIDYESVFQPSSYEKLERLVGGTGGSAGDSFGGGGGGGAASDEEVPF